MTTTERGGFGRADATAIGLSIGDLIAVPGIEVVRMELDRRTPSMTPGGHDDPPDLWRVVVGSRAIDGAALVHRLHDERLDLVLARALDSVWRAAGR